MAQSLDQLGVKHGTDKSSKHHNYLNIYDKYFHSYRDKEFNFLEIGWGGYEFIDRGGQSAYMWMDYFSKASINVLELYEKQYKKDGRLSIFQGSQDDEGYLKIVNYQAGPFNIIIDDGSHVNPLTIASFKILFPLLMPRGLYVIEDCHTAYWEEPASDGQEFKGSRNPLAEPESSIMNYMKSLTDTLNFENQFQIESIHFYKQLIFIHKS